MSETFRSLRSYNYRVWFIGALVANIGSWMQATTQSWVVLTDLTDNDAVAVGITMALQFGPQLLLVPITGLLADRVSKRVILCCAQISLMALAISLGCLLLFGQAQLWHMYLFALLLGIILAVESPARQTFVAELVSEHNMSNAVALNAASFNSARMIGPAIAGVLIVVVGAGWVFIINSVAFIAVLVAIAMLRTSQLRVFPTAQRQRGDLIEGFRYVSRRPDLVVVFSIVFLIGAFGMNFPIFASTMAVEFGRGAGEYGLLSSILAVGSLAGALLSARRARARMKVVVLAAAGFGVASIVAAVMPSFWLFAFSLTFIGFATVTLMTTANGLVQTTIDPAVRGRVMALYMAVFMGGTPVGAPIVGAVADGLGPRWALVVAAVAGFVAAGTAVVWVLVSKRMSVALRPNSRWRLVVTQTNPDDSVGPESFAEPLALTSPITLPGSTRKRRRTAPDE